MLTKSGPLRSFFLLIFVAPARQFGCHFRAKGGKTVLLLRFLKSSAAMIFATCGKNVAAAWICAQSKPQSAADIVVKRVLSPPRDKRLAGALISTT